MKNFSSMALHWGLILAIWAATVMHRQFHVLLWNSARPHTFTRHFTYMEFLICLWLDENGGMLCTCTWRGMLVLLCEGYMLSGLFSLKISRTTVMPYQQEMTWNNKKRCYQTSFQNSKSWRRYHLNLSLLFRWSGAMFHLIVKRLRFLQTLCNH